jgi:hypothetical protein
MYSEKKLNQIISPEIEEFISAHRLGYGLWIWKPIVILDFLEKNPRCEAVLYLDAGCDFNSSDSAVRKWNEYLSHLKDYNAVVFQTIYPEESYTKKQLVKTIGNKNSDITTGQIQAGAFLMNRKYAIDFCKIWLDYMSGNNFKLLKNEENDSDSELYENYIDYRYDQSIFSLLVKRGQNVKILQASLESEFAPNWKTGLQFPILTSRNRSIVPVLQTGLVHRILRRLERRLIRTYNTFNQYSLDRRIR